MSTQIIDSDRTFQLWKYTVGHGQLLLRSTKGPNVPTRIDVLFKGVSEFHLPTLLSGLSIREASDDQIRDLCSLRESPSFNHGKVYRVKGTDFIGYVAALSCYCHEDEGEYYAPSFFSKSNYPQIRPVISVTLSPKVCGDWDKLQHALSVLAQQDPSMRTTTQPTERRVIIKGRGELHLQAICDRLVREFGVPLDLEKLIVITSVLARLLRK